MTLKELDLQNAVYGDIPERFQHRMQYTLRRTQKEEFPVERFTIRTGVIVLVLIAITGVAPAAFSSITAERYSQEFGQRYKDALLQSNIDASPRSKQPGNVFFHPDDVIVTGITLDNEKDNLARIPCPSATWSAPASMLPALSAPLKEPTWC